MERLICLAIGYVCGLFQTSYIIGRFYKTDIREHGSGNAGTTNALRTFGKKAGAMTLLGDCLKCVAAILLVKLFLGKTYGDILPLLTVYAAAGCILGHNFPFYLNFRGGKGIAASVGFILAFDWRIFLICAVLFFTLFFTTHYVSVCSLSAYLAAFLAMIFWGQKGVYGMDPAHMTEMYVVMGLMTALAFFRHRANVVRLLNGTENRIYLGKTKNKKG
ncbi:MAG: glycerol-3-phosphate 1-O-acyltransferase PlsY [Blautia sp.]|uniref:glycerol-3-phosphate 1-O-acyltransferase PlsY n=1 Tax=Blautia sp. TaxID=1955243 RepID=UPI002942D457|nr:glycerol-3-phosphate 1-O-acyltransferase PlsY [Blautia sp.]MDY3016339.1 glycerol-3-phosphate 1-O-acyltransferase PlsY [Blautia sp.]